ncbi:uncharacterized protein LOC135362272 [Mirounga angustirostris]|uniref:uncharacterized protein LOC135362272 n=1 Tax=Mirounga angustirostris TaxID=9716 RepID=UPI00313ABFC8
MGCGSSPEGPHQKDLFLSSLPYLTAGWPARPSPHMFFLCPPCARHALRVWNVALRKQHAPQPPDLAFPGSGQSQPRISVRLSPARHRLALCPHLWEGRGGGWRPPSALAPSWRPARLQTESLSCCGRPVSPIVEGAASTHRPLARPGCCTRGHLRGAGTVWWCPWGAWALLLQAWGGTGGGGNLQEPGEGPGSWPSTGRRQGQHAAVLEDAGVGWGGWLRVAVPDPERESRALNASGLGPSAAFSWSPLTSDGQYTFPLRTLAPGRHSNAGVLLHQPSCGATWCFRGCGSLPGRCVCLELPSSLVWVTEHPGSILGQREQTGGAREGGGRPVGRCRPAVRARGASARAAGPMRSR